LDVEHGEMVALTTIVVKHGSGLFLPHSRGSMTCCGIVKLRRGRLLWPLVGPTRNGPACVGCIDMRAQAEVPSARRTDTPCQAYCNSLKRPRCQN
jgi:hypothetical protein